MSKAHDSQRLYPLPEVVAGYGSRSEFDSSNQTAGQWVFWEDRVNLVLQGRYDEVKPLHVELSPTYLCNFACPWCSCRSAREDWCEDDVFSHPKATEFTVMAVDRLRRLLLNLSSHRVGIQWVGGEPTMHQALYPMALLADQLGLKQCLFTNGSLLSEGRLETLFQANLVFIRFSLDAVSDDVHRLHHGYHDSRDYSTRVRSNIERAIAIKTRQKSRTAVSLSLVVDETNIDDVIPTCEYALGLSERYGGDVIAYIIVRPAVPFYTAQVSLTESTVPKLLELVGESSQMRARLAEAGIRLVTPSASYGPSDSDRQSAEPCLAAGWFSEVSPDGTMYLCSDRYGNPEYAIGNAVDSSLDDVWNTRKRVRALRYANATRCFGSKCPRNGRGYSFNKIFHAVERKRKAGEIEGVRRWIEDLRKILPKPDHSFFL